MTMHSATCAERLKHACEVIGHESSLAVARSIEARKLSKALREQSRTGRSSAVCAATEVKSWTQAT